MMIHGIACSIESRRVQKVIDMVLRQIRQRAPEDFERIKRRVWEVAPLPASKSYMNVAGHWRRLTPEGHDDEDCPGVVEVSSRRKGLTATVAHEFAHACGRGKDVFDGDDAKLLPWEERSELIADVYARRWGFRRRLPAYRCERGRWERVISVTHPGGLSYMYLYSFGPRVRETAMMKKFRLMGIRVLKATMTKTGKIRFMFTSYFP
jgi:hypothetical protein